MVGQNLEWPKNKQLGFFFALTVAYFVDGFLSVLLLAEEETEGVFW